MSTPLRVLIVEDSEDDTLLLIKALRRGGYEPEFERVQTAESLRTTLRGKDWDMILCDYSMPAFDAPAALRVLQESAREIPFIIVSGVVGEDVAIEALKLGADDYVLKQNLIRLMPAIERSLKDAENRRRRSAAERMRKLIMAHSFDMIWVLDKYGRHVDTSAASLHVLGYNPEELVGQDAFQHVHPDDLPLCRKTFEDVIAGNAVRDFECRCVRKDGRIIHMMWSAYWSPDDALLFAVGRDITERKRAEEALRLAAERVQLAAQAGKMGIWEVDLATGTPIWDDQMYRLYGLRRGAAADGFERWHRRFHPEDAARAISELHEALEKPGTPLDSEFRIIREDDGRTCHIRCTGTVVRDQSGRPSRMIGINWDVTEERIREEKLSEALSREKELAREALAGDRAKSEFLAVMSHEIRTPMNGVLGFAQLLSHVPSLTSDCRNYAQTIMESGEALLRILDDVLDFSRLEAGRLGIEKSRFSPREMLKSIRALLAQRASEKELKLHMVIDNAVPEHLEGDAGRLRQVLLNLVGNAIKFTERGWITLGLRRSPERSFTGALSFEFSVKDTGLGITPGQIERIFQPFTQADSSISRRYGGTGLGLSISRSLTELMGGRLTVQSQPGQGSEFFVTVPLDVPEQASDIGAETPQEPLDVAFAEKHPLRILLVEDDRENLKLLLTLSRSLGYEPRAARNGREAVEIYQQEQPSCLLMDLRMPEMDGIEATEKIRALETASGTGKQAFIAALTADIFPAGRQRCIDAGMNAYLNKPVKLSALAEMLTKACDFAGGYS